MKKDMNAIDKVRQMVADGQVSQEAAEKYFPELKERGGVKIRERLIAFLSQCKAVYGDRFKQFELNIDEALAWLEKQGEQKSADNVEPKFKVGDTIYYNSFGEVKSMIVANIITDSTDNPMYEDKEGNAVLEKDIIEQKPWSEEDEKKLNDIIKDLVHPWNEYIPDRIEDEIKWLKNRLKSLKDRVGCEVNSITTKEWSEDDEQYLLICKNALAKYQVSDKWDATIISRWLENKLKSPKERVQSKQEWSEDTQQWIDTIIKDYEDLYNADKDHRATIQAKINILKSIRPQSTWKPSDEQMEALKSSTYCPNKQMSKVLFELYQDLKKLREE